jgi:hypothetical protein
MCAEPLLTLTASGKAIDSDVTGVCDQKYRLTMPFARQYRDPIAWQFACADGPAF